MLNTSAEFNNSFSEKDGIVFIFSNQKRQLQTTRSYNLMSFSMSKPHSSFGRSDVIIDIINSRIWSDSKSFDDTCLGSLPPKWKDIYYSDSYFECNNKIIGGHYYYFKDDDILGPWDINKYKSQTTSITTDKLIANTSLSDLVEGNDGSRIYSVKNCALWMLTVVSSTIDCKFVFHMKLENGQVYQGMTVNTDDSGNILYLLLYIANIPNTCAQFDSLFFRHISCTWVCC